MNGMALRLRNPKQRLWKCKDTEKKLNKTTYESRSKKNR